MLVLVDFLQAGLVDVRVLVGIAVVFVVVRVLDVLVVVAGVSVHVRLAVVLVLVGVRCVVGVVVGHVAPWVGVFMFDGGRMRRVGRAGVEVLDVAKRLIEQRGDVRVIQRVDHVAAGAAAEHEPEVAQDPQLV